MNKIKKSIKLKLITAFLIAGLIPFIIFLIFSIIYGKQIITKNIKKHLNSHITFSIKILNTEISFIDKQMNLWSKYQILDDILTDDIDKRIQDFLENLKKNTQIDGIFICSDIEGKIIASTDKKLIGKIINPKYLNQNFVDLHKPEFLRNYTFTFSKPVYASFNKQKIGYLSLLYFTKNLNKYISITENQFTLLFNENKKHFIGQSIDIFSYQLKEQGFIDAQDFLIVYQKIKNSIFKDNWYFVSAIEKTYAFEILSKLKNLLFITSIIGLISTLIIISILSEKLVRPIKTLSDFVNYITIKKDYTKTINLKSEDEIGVLIKSFNEMIKEINKALTKLEQESLERLRLFLKLTGTFNEITKTDNIQQIFEILKKQLKEFPHIKDIGFSAIAIKDSINIRINTEEIKGFLYFKTDTKLTNEEERFFKSIGIFVNLWIERIELLEKATQSSKAKSAFIANMSHELRTPLNSIIGFAQFLQMVDDLPNEYKEIVKNIETSGKHLLELINDILDFSKAEAGKIKVNKINTNIYSIIKESVDIVSSLAKEKQLEIKIKINKNLNHEIDVKLFKQIILNLLSNAIKFTETGHIEIKAKKLCGKLYVRVKDTGIGIEKENIKKLFDDFSQLENPMQKKYKGTGLGLSITKKFINLMGGEIKAYSKGKNQGTRFIFYI